MKALIDIVKGRKSVRTFDGTGINEEDRKDIENYITGITNPFDVHVEFILLDADKHGLSSPVLSGERLYVAGKVEKTEYAAVAYGYSFEKLCLHAWDKGIGTVLIGGTMKRELFEAAAGVKGGEMMPCVTPLGYPAKKRSVKEIMMRKGIGADSRISAEKLFFKDKWGSPLNAEGDMAEILEMVRWAPSAVNKQPWRIVYKDGTYHFYEKKDAGFDRPETGDLQKIDMGIALCHMCMGLEEKGINAEVVIGDPGLDIPEGAEYIVSVRV